MEKNKSIMNDVKKDYLVKRLNVIEGQVRGVSSMIENNRSYEDVLIQLGALTNSLKSVGRNILENYMYENLDKKHEKEIEEIINLFNKLV